MSTRSYICKENEDGSIIGSYCHSDGYLTYNGAMLLDHYNTRERVEALIALGSISSLHEKLEPDSELGEHSFDYDERQENVTIAYGRDRGETDQEAHNVKLADLDAPESWIDYVYIFGLDDTWRYFECGQLTEGFRSVEEDLKEYYVENGISSRPHGIYGYLDESEFAQLRELQNELLKLEQQMCGIKNEVVM